MSDCIFCKIANHEIPAKIVFENDEIIAFDDIHPKAPIHVVVIPKSHDTPVWIAKAVKQVARTKKIDKTGYRVIINQGKDAGQEIDHFHAHVLGGKPLGPILCM
mgnify:CR=1 FL=1